MTVKKVKIKRNSTILTVLALALVCYFVATVVSLQTKVHAKERSIAQLSEQYKEQLDDNDELKQIIDSGNENDYIERIAREDYGYAMPDERVYYDSSAS